MDKIRIFIADDHPIVTLGIKALLKNSDGKELVGIAHSNQHLVKLLTGKNVDVLLLDLNMPGHSFKQLIPELKKHFKTLKIVVYTSYQEKRIAKPVIKLGIDGYILKSDSPTKLLHAIEMAHQGDRCISNGVRLSEAYAKSDNSPSPNTKLDIFQKIQKLTPRELEICKLICQAYTSQKIASLLFISKHTVETHRKHILRKLNVNNIVELIGLVSQLNINHLGVPQSND